MISSIQPHSGSQSGSVLLEGLFAILIFSIGVLGIVGLQVASVKQATDAKYRTEAALLANQLIGQMWASDRSLATLRNSFSSALAGAGYTAWIGDAAAPTSGTVRATLPKVSAVDGTLPIVTIGATSGVTIQIFWKQPSDTASDPVRKYTINATIK
jgi:type IV pilus assembly protein PilV